METKRCLGCEDEKLLEEFPWWVKAKGIRKPRCQACDKEYRARYYRENKEKAQQRSSRAIETRKKNVASGVLFELAEKQCLDCEEILLSSAFGWANEAMAIRKPRCLDCDVLRRRRRYEGNREQYLESNKRTQAKLRKIVEEYKNKPCADCGKSYPYYVMDFDHLDGATKRNKVSALVFVGSERILLEEIVKCDVVCSNCHRERTHGSGRRKENGPRKSRIS